ncbi:MAG: hypothetical protein NTX53_09275 [candidate division WOR-3 bacterium]|nr:hypothetical protein [candidate division WOR-3 bacterium]
MKRRTISILGLLTALLGIGCSDANNLRITLRPADTTQYSARGARRLRGDSSRIQLRLDWLYDEPGFRPPSERAKVEPTDSTITVSVSDTSGAARIEYLASTRGLITFRQIAGDSIAGAILDSVDGWLQLHPGAAAAGPGLLDKSIFYRSYQCRVLERDYPLVSNVLKAVDTAVYDSWEPAFGVLDAGKIDTSRILYFVARQPEMSNARGRLVASAVAHRGRGTRPPNAPPVARETQPFLVDMQLSHDTFWGPDPVLKLAEFTASHVGQRLAMMLDTVVLSAPMIQDTIRDGSFMVVTRDTLGAYARDLTTIFLSGPLYPPLVVERVERVGGK